MYKIIVIASFILLSSFNKPATHNRFYENLPVKKQSIFDFKVEALDGSTIDFSKFKGKKILIVNFIFCACQTT